MEARKLQLSGGSTYVVSLPRRWVTSSGLKAGDTLFVEESGNGTVSVHARGGQRPPARRKVFDERGGEIREHLLRKLVGSYIAGYSVIELHFPEAKAPFIRRVAREFCRLVVGPEVVEETRGSIVIQDLSDPSEVSPERSLRRMHLMVRAMVEDAILAMKTGQTTLAHDVIQRDQDVDRLYWMMAKLHHRAFAGASSGPREHGTSPSLRMVAKLLERMGDHAERIAASVPTIAEHGGMDPKLAKSFEEAAESALVIFDRAFGAFVSFNIDAANEAIDQVAHHQRLVNDLYHRISGKKGEELLALGSVVDSIGRLASYSADVAEQAINLAVSQEAAPRETPPPPVRKLLAA